MPTEPQDELKVGDVVSIANSDTKPHWDYCCFDTGEVLSVQGKFATVQGSVFDCVVRRQIAVERLKVLKNTLQRGASKAKF